MRRGRTRRRRGHTPYRLDLVFTSGGVEVPVSHEAILGCVY